MEFSLNSNNRYSYADYLSWLDDIRRELLDGFIFKMTPAPLRNHQQISGNLYGHFWSYLLDKPCRVFHAPFDVRLPVNGERADTDIFTVVQPDICIVCDPSMLDEKGCLGAPNLIIEIISPASANHDINDKYAIYQRSGVLEYWIVFPSEKVIHVFLLNNQGMYEQKGTYTSGNVIPISIFHGEMQLEVSKVFANVE